MDSEKDHLHPPPKKIKMPIDHIFTWVALPKLIRLHKLLRWHIFIDMMMTLKFHFKLTWGQVSLSDLIPRRPTVRKLITFSSSSPEPLG